MYQSAVKGINWPDTSDYWPFCDSESNIYVSKCVIDTYMYVGAIQNA